MNLTIKYDGGTRFLATDGEFTVTAGVGRDSEKDNMSPGKLFIASLGMCIRTYVVKFCKRHEIPYEEIEIKLDYMNASSPTRVNKVNIELSLPEEVPEKYKSALLRVADQCYVKQSIEPKLGIKFSLSEN